MQIELERKNGVDASCDSNIEHKQHDPMSGELQQSHTEHDEAIADFQNIAEE